MIWSVTWPVKGNVDTYELDTQFESRRDLKSLACVRVTCGMHITQCDAIPNFAIPYFALISSTKPFPY